MTDRAKWIRGLIDRDDLTNAWPIASEYLTEFPDDPKALYLCGAIMSKLEHPGVALSLFRRALAFAPEQPNIWMNFGACLHDTNQFDDAREAFLRVHKLLPADPGPLGNIAASYVQEGKCNDALKYANRALALDPHNQVAKIARGFASLGLGRWSDGWEHAEALYGDSLNVRIYSPGEPEPMWDGSPGKTVVVQADQGLGDMIMFSQCLPEMVRDCKQVIVETNARLAPMFRRNFPGIIVYDTLKQSEADWPHQHQIDAHVHISYLGKFYRKTNDDFPRKPYLTACPEKRAKWRAWLEQFPRPWVGFAWKGGIPKTNNAARSMALKDLSPLLKSGGTAFSLAYQEVALEIAQWNIDNHEQIVVPDLNNEGDYGETLAFIAELDHVVTVQTTVAHACGALGKPAYVVVNNIAQWRYAYGGDRLMWYQDSLRIYRQAHGEKDWAHVVARVARDYQSFIIPRFQ
jgi:hypothetical protein